MVSFPFWSYAEEYVVSGSRVNFRSSTNFKSDSNIIKTLVEGDRLTLIKDHGKYIEAELLPSRTKGFIDKDYVELRNTHDYGETPSNAFPTVTPDTVDPNISTESALAMPLCECSGCRKTSKYGMRKHPISGRRRLHSGCDIAAPKGTYVYAVADGKVKFAGRNGGYGKTVDIQHLSTLKDKNGKTVSNRGYTTRNAHLWKILVAKGEQVKKGQRIGRVNSTGSSTGHHLHFEIAVAGATMDPEKIFDMSNASKSCSAKQEEPTGVAQ